MAKDTLNREINAGDIIVYPTSSGSSSYLKLGIVADPNSLNGKMKIHQISAYRDLNTINYQIQNPTENTYLDHVNQMVYKVSKNHSYLNFSNRAMVITLPQDVTDWLRNGL